MSDTSNPTKVDVLKFPSFVCTGDFTQQEVYDKSMHSYTQRFLDGYNVNFLAYGQTGSGKTYTLLGPADSFNKI